jgi:hypothetical protein
MSRIFAWFSNCSLVGFLVDFSPLPLKYPFPFQEEAITVPTSPDNMPVVGFILPIAINLFKDLVVLPQYRSGHKSKKRIERQGQTNRYRKLKKIY